MLSFLPQCLFWFPLLLDHICPLFLRNSFYHKVLRHFSELNIQHSLSCILYLHPFPFLKPSLNSFLCPISLYSIMSAPSPPVASSSTRSSIISASEIRGAPSSSVSVSGSTASLAESENTECIKHRVYRLITLFLGIGIPVVTNHQNRTKGPNKMGR